MSVIMTMRMGGDAGRLEAYAAEDPEGMRSIAGLAQRHGLIAHRFYGSDDGSLMVVDEWPDPESFQGFFTEAQGQIEPLMRAAGVTAEPDVTFWRKLETQDDVGWDA